MNNEDTLAFIQTYLQVDNSDKHMLVRNLSTTEPYLYRYRPMSEDFDFDALVNNQFWLQSLNNQNDKEEGLSSLSCTYDIIYKKYIYAPKDIKSSDILKNKNTSMKKELKSIRTNLGIVCFSENKNHEEMWINYADNYSGICIEYKKEDFVNDNIHIIPVYYVENRLASNYFQLIPKNGSLQLKQREVFPPEMSMVIKTLKWKYEKEWRHIDYLDNQMINTNDMSYSKFDLQINKDNIFEKTKKLTSAKSALMKKIEVTNGEGKLINGTIPNKIFIGHNMKENNKNKIIEFCNKNAISYECI